MAAMDLKVGNTVVGQVLEFRRKYTAQKIVNTALDGTVYVQNTGRPITRYETRCLCRTAEDRDKLDEGANNGDIITVTTRDNDDVTGYVENNTIEWQEWVDRHGVGRFTFIQR